VDRIEGKIKYLSAKVSGVGKQVCELKRDIRYVSLKVAALVEAVSVIIAVFSSQGPEILNGLFR